MAQGGHYSELYNTYFRHQALDYKPPEVLEEQYALSDTDAPA
jgi:hypothetical protein